MFIATNFVGCGKMMDRMQGKKSFRDDTNNIAEGHLFKFVERLQTSKNASECEQKLRDIQINLANSIDSRADEIEEFAATLPQSTTYKRVKMGPIFVRELLNAEVPKVGWQTRSYDWTQYDARLKKIEDQPVNMAWLSLNTSVRYILSNDESRIIYQKNMYLTRQDYPELKDISKTLVNCLEDLNCTSPMYNEAGAKLIARNPYYNAFGSDRDSIGKLKDLIDENLRRKSTHKNNTVLAQPNGDIILPLDPGPFVDAKDQLGKYITDIWATKGRQLKINWTTVEATPDAYKFVLGEGSGGRPFVSYKTKTVHLYADVRARTIAHEIGHVLSFPDYYYTTWHPDTCKYSEEYDEGNIMSSSDNGIVTADEWQVLDDAYHDSSAPIN